MSGLAFRTASLGAGPFAAGGAYGCVARVVGLVRSPLDRTREIAKPGSGILLRDRIVVTAAHVVTTWTGHAMATVNRVAVEVGGTICFAEKVAVPSGRFERPASGVDLAVLLLPAPVAKPDLAATLEQPSHGAPGGVLGWLSNGPGSRVVAAVEVGERYLEYTAPNLPGYSGGPVVQYDSPSRVVGAHVRHLRDRIGQAEPIDVAFVRASMEALGFRF